MSHAGALDAAAIGERSAGQGCPFIGIKREGLFSQLAAIDNQDSLVGDNIVLGSPGGQCPVLVSSLGSDAAGQETKTLKRYSQQKNNNQQNQHSSTSLHLYINIPTRFHKSAYNQTAKA